MRSASASRAPSPPTTVFPLWTADDQIGYTILQDSDLLLGSEPRRDRAAVIVGARSLAQALNHAEQLLEQY
jgi:hypothetical protein